MKVRSGLIVVLMLLTAIAAPLAAQIDQMSYAAMSTSVRDFAGLCRTTFAAQRGDPTRRSCAC